MLPMLVAVGAMACAIALIAGGRLFETRDLQAMLAAAEAAARKE
jgi:hypothetical protein